nr:MAG TPA: distal tail protein [Caudoviricetes sp.]
MKDRFWLDSECSEDFGIYLQGPIEFSQATPKVSTESVPGRNGDLHFYQGAFANRTGSVDCFALQRGVNEALDRIFRWTLLTQGYRRLETTDEPECYRMARIINGPEIEIRMKLLAPFSIEFDCMPQKFLKSGEYPISFSASGNLYNFGFPALPIINVRGNGSGMLRIGEYSVQFKNIEEYVMLDCDTQNAYKGTENKNNTISAATFPKLEHGENQIAWSGEITGIKITPRWWTL